MNTMDFSELDDIQARFQFEGQILGIANLRNGNTLYANLLRASLNNSLGVKAELISISARDTEFKYAIVCKDKLTKTQIAMLRYYIQGLEHGRSTV